MKWTLDLGNTLQKVQIPIGDVNAYEMSESNYLRKNDNAIC